MILITLLAMTMLSTNAISPPKKEANFPKEEIFKDLKIIYKITGNVEAIYHRAPTKIIKIDKKSN